jgi:site-specific recombinase XerD
VVLRRFLEYLPSSSLTAHSSIDDLTPDVVSGFLPWVTVTYLLIDRKGRGRDKVPKPTRQVYASAISRWLKWVLLEMSDTSTFSVRDVDRVARDLKDFQSGQYSRFPKLPEPGNVEKICLAARKVSVADGDETQRLLRLRNIAIVEALRSTGMRVGEIVGVDCGHLNHHDRTCWVIGKEDKEREVIFDFRAWSAVLTYIRARGYGASDPVFVSHSPRSQGKIARITTRTVQRVFESCRCAAGIEQKLTPHSFRHAFATKLLNDTGDLALVQDMMGHKSPVTTRVYAQVDRKRMIDEHRRVFGEKE